MKWLHPELSLKPAAPQDRKRGFESLAALPRPATNGERKRSFQEAAKKRKRGKAHAPRIGGNENERW